MRNHSQRQPWGLELGRSVVQEEYLAIEEPPPQYVADTEVGTYAMKECLSTEAAVNALHMPKYRGSTWNAAQAT